MIYFKWLGINALAVIVEGFQGGRAPPLFHVGTQGIIYEWKIVRPVGDVTERAGLTVFQALDLTP
jgi:hypothetical protein